MSEKKEQVLEIVGIASAVIGLIKVIVGLFGGNVTEHNLPRTKPRQNRQTDVKE